MIYDCFPFFNEIDLLLLRLEELDKYVDKFVIVESTTTHAGHPKPLYYQINKHLFTKFNHKIVHALYTPTKTDTVITRERKQRTHIIYGINKCKPEKDDIVIISDLDEIPDLSKFNKQLEHHVIYKIPNRIFYQTFKLASTAHGDVAWTIRILTYETLITDMKSDPHLVRTTGGPSAWKSPVGWHLSYFGNPFVKASEFLHCGDPQFKSSASTLKWLAEKTKTIDIQPESLPVCVQTNVDLYKNKGFFGSTGDVSVIIPTLGLMPADIFRYTMRQLIECKDVKEIIIIDNTNNRTIRNTYGDTLARKVILVEDQPNLYVNPAWNHGIKISTGKYYLLLNDDVGTHKDTITGCANYLNANEGTYIICVCPYPNRVNPTIKEWLEARDRCINGQDNIKGRGRGHFMMARKAEFIPFDDRLKIGFGDNLLYQTYPQLFNKVAHTIRNDLVLHLAHSTLSKVQDKNKNYTNIGVDRKITNSSGENAVYRAFIKKVQHDHKR